MRFFQGPAVLFTFTLVLSVTRAVSGADYYKTLGISRDASDDQIKRAYRKLALRYHPDKNKGDEEAANRFTALGNAYEVLSNKETRKVYDAVGEDGVRRHTAQHSEGQNDIFSQFFGGGFGNFGGQDSGEEVVKGDSLVIGIEVSLSDLYLGRSMRLGRDKGVVRSARGYRKCNCKKRMMTRQIGPGMFQQYAKEECEECINVNIVRSFNTFSVEVAPGESDGHEVAVFEEGEEKIDGERGDLRVQVMSLNDNFLRREGNDLHATHFIDLVDALVGFRAEITHFDGHKVKIGRTGITVPGFTDIVLGEGLPVQTDSVNFGNLKITYQIKFPEFLNRDQKEKVIGIIGRST